MFLRAVRKFQEILLKLEENQSKVIQMNSLVSRGQLYTLHMLAKTGKPALICLHATNVVSCVMLVSQERYYIF